MNETRPVQQKLYLQALKGLIIMLRRNCWCLIRSKNKEIVRVNINTQNSDSDINFVSDDLKICVGEVDNEALHKLERCLVGTARKYCEASKHFLFDFEDENVRKNMELQNWSWFKEWFSEIEPWNKFSYSQWHSTRVTVVGVALNVWNYSTFHNIACLWGEVIYFDGKTFTYQDSNRGSMFLLINQMMKIDETVILKCGNESFSIRVTEIADENVFQTYCCHDSCKENYGESSHQDRSSSFATYSKDEQTVLGPIYDIVLKEGDKDEVGQDLDMQSDSAPLVSDLEFLICNNNPNQVVVFSKEATRKFAHLSLKNKRGAKSIVEIEETILEKVARKGRKPKNVFRYIKKGIPKSKIVNSSLFDSDFLNRKKVLCNDAASTWEIGKMVGFSADCEDVVMIKELMQLQNREME
ncbi:hypothetical protein REPUB_Repub15cG0131400 [Reevesia pubescens]